MSTPTPNATGVSASTTEVLAATIAAVVERQLTQYMSVMTKEVEAIRRATEQAQQQLRAELTAQIAGVTQRVDESHQANDAHQRALQATLEERLADFAQHQQRRLNEVENRLIEMPMMAGGGDGGVDAVELANLRDAMDQQSAAAHARIDELHKATRRFDEQASALVQHVNDTTIALAQRMDEGNQALASAVEERLAFVRSTLEAVGPEVQRQLTEHAAMTAQRIDFVEHKVTDRMLAMEDRINETQGTKLAHLEATVGRIGSGFDDAMGALSQRMLELENIGLEHRDHINRLTTEVAKMDEKAIQEVKDQLSAAVGEAMLVRIEIDRLAATTDEKLDKATLRMAEIEALLSDEMDVSASVQLERLEELERALTELNPDQFVKKADPGARPAAAHSAGFPSTSLDPGSIPDSSGGGSTTTSEHTLSSF
ncbi:MAG: hypothetical protein ACOYMR_17895 [Ilumatobacteraceae bacterium]